ncbi:hypothetical protein ERJ75_001011900 [Trypanosoma vivax]|uniref:Uncharacterized protein n=1 Tax=Trypanosoma vivax (strain Y486) TaxID=1055687 RepID=G0U244_TRYVY|nr:hypothetical protein TRVL_05052 [Trypanosoma vivax]KAH8611920.1 hypothetical protein ERJ75_001011900 [Trypanosoma vivax]CCC50347.1 conserved hypothetical protein [Trypanosoma vivax Y486]
MPGTKSVGAPQGGSASRLRWTNERINVGFKGNPAPFERPKTQKSVQLDKNRQKRKLVTDRGFLPFWHGYPTLVEDARPTKHLCGLDSSKFARRHVSKRFNHYRQRLDEATGKPEIVSALHWDLKPNDLEPAYRSRYAGAVDHHPSVRGRPVTSLRKSRAVALSQAEVAVMHRIEIMNHPKFTRQSRDYKEGDAWYRSTQLEGPPQTQTRKLSLPVTCNCARMPGTDG